MTQQPQIEAFWHTYLDSLPTDAGRPETYQAWAFGPGGDVADRLAALVMAGVKTATWSLVWSYEAEGEPLPRAGDLSVILDGAGKPVCIIETTGVAVIPFNEVDAQHAFEEGEGDRSLRYWREVHWEVFSEECAALGRAPSQTMPLLCERFRRLFPLRPDEG